MDRGRRIIGFVLICISLLGLFSWERYGRDRFLYDDILELKSNAERGTVITERMIRTVKSENPGSGVLRPSDRDRVIGQEASQFIHGEAPLYREYFTKQGMAEGRDVDRYVMNIAEEWIDSSPSSMRKGDRAYLYAEGKLVTDALVRNVSEDHGGIELIVSRREQQKIAALAATGCRFVITYN